MTDGEIVKALECCLADTMICDECPIQDECINDPLFDHITKYALDLIKRQEAELEDLREIVFMDRSEAIKNLKAEAREEFAERLKLKAIQKYDWNEYVEIEDIDNTLKEMEGK